MDKHLWHRIDKNTSKPCPRWGHACCVINEEIVFFGGYADSNYMNDLWSYNSTTMSWEEVQTTGEKPSHRSNCSMNYDPETNQIVIFGGGGPNKQRFNSVNVLNWGTKHWTQLNPKQNELGPWERTYHVAQLKFPYLVVFGGEGVSDLDDTWFFNFHTARWKQIKFERDGLKPCARRFHSSCIIGNQMFVVAGCYGKYRCLSDVFSLDLTPLLETGETKQLRWVERKLKNASFLTRWGHSTSVYNGKIYVFAGRFSNDLNDLLVIDPAKNTLKGVKIGGNVLDQPKPRRRHSAGFVGSCMIAFGGFNGEYFNDLHYVNVFELVNKLEVSAPENKWASLVEKEQLSDGVIYSSNNKPHFIHYGLIARYFESLSDFGDYISQINHKYSDEELKNLFTCLYKGYGPFKGDQTSQKYGLVMPTQINRRSFLNKMLKQESNERNALKLATQNYEKTTELVVELKRTEFQAFLINRRNQWYNDATIEVNNLEIRVNKTLLSSSISYFKRLFSGQFEDDLAFSLLLPKQYSGIVINMLLNYGMMGIAVVPQQLSTQSWMDLAELAEYFCIEDLKDICQSQLCSRVHSEGNKKLQIFSHSLELENLSLHCASYELKSSLKTNELKRKVSAMKQSCEKHHNSFIRLYETIKFDLLHSNVLSDKEGLKAKKSSESETAIEEKENNRECTNA